MDCTVYQSPCTVTDVRGYPAFKYFNYYKNYYKNDYKNTKPYNGGRTVSSVLS